MKKVFSTISMILVLAVFVSILSPAKTVKTNSVRKETKVTQKELDHYFSKSAFVGNSVSLALKYYTRTKKKSFMGSPKMLVYGCYSFINDMTSYRQYMIHYKGRPMKAKDAIKAAGVKRAFICMGTNDMNTSRNLVYTHYVRYIKGIQKKNPGIVIFIESTTPVRKNKGLLNNKEINKLNRKMKKYADNHKDVYYININTPMRDKTGRFRSQYCSDGFCHVTMKGCQVWLKLVSRYVKKLLQAEKDARRSVKATEKSLSKEDYKIAKERIEKLEDSTVKSKLKKRLHKVKNKIKRKQSQNQDSKVKPTPTPIPSSSPVPSPVITATPVPTNTPTGATDGTSERQ